MSLTQEAEVHALDFGNQHSLKALLMHFLSPSPWQWNKVSDRSAPILEIKQRGIRHKGIPIRLTFPSGEFLLPLIKNEHILWNIGPPVSPVRERFLINSIIHFPLLLAQCCCMTFEDLAYFYDTCMVLFVIVEFDSTHPHLLFSLYEKEKIGYCLSKK